MINHNLFDLIRFCYDQLFYLKPFLTEIYSLVCVSHTGVLYQGPEHHEEADEEIDVNGLHVGDLGQGGVDGVDEGGHGEDSGDTQPYPGWSCSSVEPE